MNLQALLNDTIAPDVELCGLSEHTAEVEPGFGFIGVAENAQSLAAHCRAAVQRGASALLHDAPDSSVLDGFDVPVVRVGGLASKRGGLAARFYGDPSAGMTCVGITGTNGKTSVAHHVADLSSRLGTAMGYSGTLGWGAIGALQCSDTTTGNAVALQRRLAAMRDQGMTGAALEVSSHALDQDRAAAVHFDYAVFTNLTRDHLDYHGTHSAYARAKTKLFTQWPLQAAVINVADSFGAELADRLRIPVVSYGAGGDWSWAAEPGASGMRVTWRTPHGLHRLELPVVADFAIANMTAAAATLVCIGHAPARVFALLTHLTPVPGRMEVVSPLPGRPTAVVDYAHTPDALTKALAALRPFCRGRLICVVGCGGDRDAGKRPLMGKAAVQGADLVWFTSDNPRSEAPADIIAAMRAGVSGDVHECVDRAQAIREALSVAAAADVVLVAGKGHETYQEIGGRRLPFDDRRVVAEVLEVMS